MKGYLEFVARDRNTDQRSKVGAGTIKSDETIFEESVRLDTEGFVYHPNFMEFALGGLFGLLQQDNREAFDDRIRQFSDDGDFVEFDFDGYFFKKKPYPGQVFARRHRRLTPRPFQASLETTTTTYGLNWQYVHPKYPTSLQYNFTNVDLNSLDPEEQDGRQRDELLRFETGYKFSEHSELSLDYERRQVEQKPFTLDYDSDEVTLTHDHRFGDGHRQRLESELNYFDQRGTFDIRRARWREILRLEHSETLRSWYRWELLDRKQGTLAGVVPIEERSYYLSGTVEHQLYQSLTSEFFAFGQTQDFESGLEIDRWGVQASFDYRKNNRWGQLVADYRVRYQEESRTGAEQAVEIVDEARTFADPEPIVLTQTNVNLSSLTITDEARTTLYRSGDDYRVRTFPNRIEIERVPTGRIADGQTVLLDYQYTLGSDFDLDTLLQTFSVRQNFTMGLSPYYRLRWQRQDIVPEDAVGAVAEDITGHLIGAEFRRGGFRVFSEYEDHDSTITPLRAKRLGAEYTRRFAFGATGILKARWSEVDFREPDRLRRFLTLEGRWRHPITEHLTLESALMFRREKDTLSGHDEGIDFDLSLEWMVRQTEMRLTYEVGKFDDEFSANEFSRLYVQVRRSF